MRQHRTTDVLVVGAGPAGLTVAGSLARQGVDVLVVERHAGTSPFPKATGISTRTMEIFRGWGIEDAIRAGAMRVRPLMTMSRTLAEGPFLTMPFGFPTDAQALAVSPSTPSAAAQDHLEPVLVRHLVANGGRIRFDTELAGLDVHAAGVTAELRNRVTGQTTRIRARYVVGADGPRSTVRAAVGIDVDDLGSIGEYMAITFRAPLSELFADLPGALNMVQIDGAEGLFVPTGADDRWIYACELDPRAGEDPASWTPDRCLELLRIGSGVPDLDPALISVMPFTMGGHVARAFRAGRAFLVGDAAHRTTPVGGTGMNMAIQAAHNLGWKLGWVVRGLAGDALLDSYESERRPIGTENVIRSLRRGEPSGDGLAWDIGVHYASAAHGAPGDGPARPGDRAPHAWVVVNGETRSTHDLFDGTFTVLGEPAAGKAARKALADLAAELPIRLRVVGSDDFGDVDGDVAKRYGLRPREVVLVRPDGYIAWRGESGGAIVSAVEGAIGGTVTAGAAAVA